MISQNDPLVGSNEATLLPATKHFLQSSPVRNNIHLLVMQHALRDTSEFLRLAKAANFTISAMVAKPNSLDHSAVKNILAQDIPVITEPEGTTPPYSFFRESSVLADAIEKASQEATMHSRRLVIIDVGGHFCPHIQTLAPSTLASIAGVIEVTTLGHNVYRKQVANVGIPIVSLARSELKDAEAVHVGETVVQATEDMLRDVGYILGGKRCGVVGFGMIGSRIADALQRRSIPVRIGDLQNTNKLQARLSNIATTTMSQLLSESDILFSATATQAVDLEMLQEAQDGVLLVSGGSKANEFDVEGIKQAATKCTDLTENLMKYVLPWGKACVIANSGKAVNFLKGGSPEEIMDVVFAEQAACIDFLGSTDPALEHVNELHQNRRDEIARVWMEIQNNVGMGVFKNIAA